MMGPAQPNRKAQVVLGALIALLLLGVLGVAVSSTTGWRTTPTGVGRDLVVAGNLLWAEGENLRMAQDKAHMDELLPRAHGAYMAANKTILEAIAQVHAMHEVSRSGVDFSPALTALETAQASFARWSHLYDPDTDEVQAMSYTHSLAEETRAAGAAVSGLEVPASKANDLASVTDALFGAQVIPFEVLGVLLTAVMIGALVTARPLTVHGSEESSLVHPNLSETTLPATDPVLPPPVIEAPSLPSAAAVEVRP
ncbi:MAG: hypothetical protein ABR562_08760 [Thermoplasmatota archaeon]|nr:NADH-quinone oxidoreductase subunit J [Halobacteriales archaeon]